MPTRKQRRRDAKSKRHEYEFVYVDGEGNELEEVPEELAEPRDRQNGTRPDRSKASDSKKSTSKQPARGGRRQGRTAQPPSWRRSVRRALLLGGVVFVLFSLTGRGGNGRYLVALQLTILYTALFVPFTYAIDRFAYRRWQSRQAGGAATPAKKPAKKSG
jgi:hypothetical protein